MKSIDVNKTPLGIVGESIGYYVAGLFALWVGISSQQDRNSLLIGTGIILLVYGIILLIEPLKKRLEDKIPNRVKPHIDIIKVVFLVLMLSICCTQLMINAVTYGTVFFILACIYLATFVSVSIHNAKSVFGNREFVTMIILLTIFGFIQYFRARSLSWHRWDLLFILILWLVFLGFLLKNVSRTRKNRAKSNKGQNARNEII